MVDVLIFMASRNLDTNASLSLWDNREREADDVDTTCQHCVGKLSGNTCVTNHDGTDGMDGIAAHVEAGGGHAVAKAACVGGKLRAGERL